MSEYSIDNGRRVQWPYDPDWALGRRFGIVVSETSTYVTLQADDDRDGSDLKRVERSVYDALPAFAR